AAVHIDLLDELVHGGDQVLPAAAPDHIDLVGGRGEDVGDGAQHGAGLGVPDLQAHEIGQEVAAVGELHAGAVDGDGLALEAHGGVHVGHAFQPGQHVALVGPGGLDLHGGAVYI